MPSLSHPLENLEHVDIGVFLGNSIIDFLQVIGNMLSVVGRLEGGDDALVERLNSGGDIRWKEDHEYIKVLETLKGTLMSKIFCMFIYHFVRAEVVHQQQHFSIFNLCSNTMRELSNHRCKYNRAHQGDGIEMIINAVVAKRIEAPTNEDVWLPQLTVSVYRSLLH